MRRIFGPRGINTGRLEELHRLIKSRMYEMGGAYSPHDREEGCIKGFGGQTRRDHWEDLDACGRIILKHSSFQFSLSFSSRTLTYSDHLLPTVRLNLYGDVHFLVNFRTNSTE